MLPSEFPRGARTCALFLAAALSGCGEQPAIDARPPVILWIEVDTLRADALGCYGNPLRDAEGVTTSPTVDALAEAGVLFERAYATAPWTIPSVASQLTGLAPWEHGALRLLQPMDAGLRTFVEDFRDAGWATVGVMTNFVATRERAGFQRGFQHWDESLATGHAGSTGKRAAARLLQLVDEVRAETPDKPLFLFLFLFEPHYRYEEHAGREFPVDGVTPSNYAGDLPPDLELTKLRQLRHELHAADLAVLRSRYHGEVAAADAAVGVALDGLAERGLADTAWVVFTSDHGEELMERGWIGHTINLRDELVRVPLVVRPPAGVLEERRGTRNAHAVSLIDLGATLRELAGVVEGRTPGESFAEAVRTGGPGARRVLPLHVDFEPLVRTEANLQKEQLAFGAVDALHGLKWLSVLTRNIHGLYSVYLYDLEADPGELNKLTPSAVGDRWDGALELVPELRLTRAPEQQESDE